VFLWLALVCDLGSGARDAMTGLTLSRFFRLIAAFPQVTRLAYRLTLWKTNPQEMDSVLENPMFRRDYEAIKTYVWGDESWRKSA
jgi:hypothetical protein